MSAWPSDEKTPITDTDFKEALYLEPTSKEKAKGKEVRFQVYKDIDSTYKDNINATVPGYCHILNSKLC